MLAVTLGALGVRGQQEDSVTRLGWGPYFVAWTMTMYNISFVWWLLGNCKRDFTYTIYIYIYIYSIWYMVSCSVFLPPQRYGSPGSTPALLFASCLWHIWGPASHWLGICCLLDDLHRTHTSSKYLRSTYTVSTYMLLLPIYYLQH